MSPEEILAMAKAQATTITELESRLEILSNKNNELETTVSNLKGEAETRESIVSELTAENEKLSLQLGKAKVLLQVEVGGKNYRINTKKTIFESEKYTPEDIRDNKNGVADRMVKKKVQFMELVEE